MSFVKTQEEIRANHIMAIRETIDLAEAEGRGLDGLEQEKIAKLEDAIRSVDEMIAVATRNEERAVEVAEATRGFAPAEEAREVDVFRAMANGEVRSHQFEARSTLVPSVNTVPVSFSDRVFSLARLVGPMLDTSDVILRSSGESLRLPVISAYGTASQVSAGSTISDAEPTFDSVLLTPWKIGGLVPIANELIADQGFDLEGAIAEATGNSIGYTANALLTTGTGTVQPTGIVNGAGSGVASTATSLNTDSLISLAHSVDGAVRRMSGAGFMVNTATLGDIRKLKDGNGAYVFNPVVGGPDTILGFPVIENPAMANVGSGVKSVLFGDLNSYKVASTPLSFAVSADAQFEKDITVYRWTLRLDGALSHSAHVKYLTTA